MPTIQKCSGLLPHGAPPFAELRGIFLLLVFEGTAVSVYQRDENGLFAGVTKRLGGNREPEQATVAEDTCAETASP